MRAVVVVVLALVAASAGWRYRGAIDRWLAPPAALPKSIVFDNGTVREVLPPASAAATSTARPGGLRKCVRGSQTTYTNVDCPAGFKEKAVSADRIMVLEGQRGAPATGRAASAPPGAQRRLQDVLDLSADDKLRQRMMDRAIEAGSR